MDYTLANEQIRVQIHDKGAELFSLEKNGKEYVWNADPKFWARSTPILFPFVGSLREKKYRYQGKEYPMGQHGFARDMEFSLIQKTEDSALFSLVANEQSKLVYPFDFELQIGYTLVGNSVIVSWKVINRDDKTLYFSIGGHPGFMCPLDFKESQKAYKIYIQKEGKPVDKIYANVIGEGGLATQTFDEHSLENGYLAISEELFAKDALVLENKQADQIALVDSNGEAYVTVEFDTPLVGIWTPPHKNAPFICIEPWYGRCDSIDFQGELQNRQWGNKLEVGEVFKTELKIEVK